MRISNSGWSQAAILRRDCGPFSRRPILRWRAPLLVLMVTFVLLACAGDAPQEQDTGATPLEGDTAPDFSLTGADGQLVTLSQLLQGHQAVVLVFYRGFF